MFSFILRRVLATLPVIIVVALVVFLMTRLSPVDPAVVLAGDNASEQDVQRARASLGLNDPLPVQFGHWSLHVAQGDLGQSFFAKMPVTQLIVQRMEPTASLAGLTLVLTVLMAVPLGILAAWRHGGWLDRALMALSALGFSVPAFVIGYLLIWFFALHLKWLPVQGYGRLADGIGPWLRQLVLPSVTLSIVYIALIARVTRAAMAEAMTEDYIRTARAKGISEARLLVRHALANAAVPVVTVIGLGVAMLIGGVVVTESVFAIPGLGSLTVDAVLSRDFPVIQGLTLFFSMVYITINLLIDISYRWFDPRIRY